MFIQNQILNETYQILHPIGSGGTSSVYLAYHLRLQKYVVVKQLKGSFTDNFILRTEVDILKNLHHPNLPQVYDFVQTNQSVHTVIDYVDGNDLEYYIKNGNRFAEPLLKHYLRQIAEVLDYLHSQNPSVIHSDIKPGNIIIDSKGDAILIDFNTSIGGNYGNLLGLTLPYASPEQIELAGYLTTGQQPPFELDGRSDLFSLGATFYELICGVCPTPGVKPVPLRTMGLSEYTQEFLSLIDKLMEYDPSRRVKSAKALKIAIDRLDSRYWRYLTMRCASLLVSAALIGVGLFCLIHGGKQMRTEEYRSAYQTAEVYIENGYFDQAEQLCTGLLSDSKMQNYLNDHPADQARLYHAIGDIYYYRDQYDTAAGYYRHSVQYGSGVPAEEMAAFLRDAAIAYAQMGDVNTASQYLDLARSKEATGEDLSLISIVIAARSGDRQRCVAEAGQLLSVCQNPEICMRAALTAAQACSDSESKIQWLRTACAYDSGKTALRGLAVAYAEKANNAKTTTEQQAALNDAEEIFAQLCDSLYASATDRINYSTVLRMNQKQQKALEVLQTALSLDGSNYCIMANLCFAYYELGDMTQAQAYCNRAIRAWKADNSSQRLSESSEEIQSLLEIGRRFGLGG